MSLISVVMSTYREPEKYIRPAVESILSQTLADFEFLIVLDAPDNTAMQELLAEYAARDSRIRLLKNEKNIGLVGSLNRALGEATGEFVARMDADDIAEPDRLEKELAYLRENDLDFVAAVTRRIDEDGNPIAGSAAPQYSPAAVMASLRVSPCLPHPTWLLKREVYEALGGYRGMERCEDYDFALRALKRGYRIGVCPAVLLNYRIVSSGISRTALLKQHLASRYLAANFDRLEQVTMQEIREKKLARVSDAEAERYRRAEQLFFKALTYRRNPLKLGAYLIASLFTSRHQVTRFSDMYRLRKARKNAQ